MANRELLRWLLEEEQPAARFRTLTELEGRAATDGAVKETRRQIPEIGWAADILAERDPAGWWVNPKNHYEPKYVSTNWKMLVLSDLGLTREHPTIRASCELWMRMKPMRKGAPGTELPGPLHHCVVGNAARAMIRFGYADDPRVRRTLDWIVASADPKGGWSCFGRGRNLDSWEGLSALGAYPRAKRSAAMQRAIERGAEFFLERELHRQGGRYAPWYRFHYPVHYYYDLLVGLELLTGLGYTDDARLRYARSVLEEKRRRDGRWNLDAVHPDVEGSVARWYETHPRHRPTPFALERVGAPSKMITLRALLVLDRLDS